jgi:geranylgeranyl reductase family protein
VELPSSCDVLIVGAGPAGSAAAIELGRAGVGVVLIDQRTFPREKVCGDGLISDALGALKALAIDETVARESIPGSELRVYPPGGRHVAIPGAFACLPRERLDTILSDAAQTAGAHRVYGATASAVLEDRGRVVGARVNAGGSQVDVRATLTLLATGANATALKTFGLQASMQPSAVAGRAYYQATPELAAKYSSLIIGYDKEWCPGYGWIFPSPGNRFNIGVGLFMGRSNERRLRDFWQVFTARFAPAAEILRAATAVTPFRGAPLRTAMVGDTFGRPGLFAIGEAAALTYAATGEGIGKAMESGIIAARHVRDALNGRAPLESAHVRYEAEFKRAFAFRYRAYSVAQAWAAHPWVLSLLAARTNAGRFAQRELEDLIAERGDARHLFSKKGLLKALFR